ncbi:hypothetical protein WG936_05420 [Corynebacterium sp. H127]|uniref:hypothetical protein n=1 Tax=Corynebacterium sp. H127 TaxID=3133418 RepID=UPI0030AF3E8F
MNDSWNLGKHLRDLERCGPLLDQLLFPRQSCSGESAGVAPKGGKSRPPLQVAMVDLKSETESLLCGWSVKLAVVSAEVLPLPEERSIRARAAWLQRHLFQLEAMPWLDLAASQLIAQAQLVSDVVEPRGGEVDPVEVGSPESVASWACHLGVRVSKRSVYRWAQAGLISSELLPDGRLVVRLSEVLEKAGQGRFFNIGTAML